MKSGEAKQIKQAEIEESKKRQGGGGWCGKLAKHYFKQISGVTRFVDRNSSHFGQASC
jgi:hypothetical protein